jgi:ABC-type transporter Mla maintaining outer membrane lipid asymmetry ATPase subunit MlaF
MIIFQVTIEAFGGYFGIFRNLINWRFFVCVFAVTYGILVDFLNSNFISSILLSKNFDINLAIFIVLMQFVNTYINTKKTILMYDLGCIYAGIVTEYIENMLKKSSKHFTGKYNISARAKFLYQISTMYDSSFTVIIDEFIKILTTLVLNFTIISNITIFTSLILYYMFMFLLTRKLKDYILSYKSDTDIVNVNRNPDSASRLVINNHINKLFGWITPDFKEKIWERNVIYANDYFYNGIHKNLVEFINNVYCIIISAYFLANNNYLNAFVIIQNKSKFCGLISSLVVIQNLIHNQITRNQEICIILEELVDEKFVIQEPPHLKDDDYDKIDNAIKNKQIIGINGPSGCGKTTLIGRLIGEIFTSKIIPTITNTCFSFGQYSGILDIKDNTTIIHKVNLVFPEFKSNIILLNEIFYNFSLDVNMLNSEYFPLGLSGGTLQRISLASFFYKVILTVKKYNRKNITITLDEPERGRDYGVFLNIIKYILTKLEEYNYTLILVSHQTNIFKEPFFNSKNAICINL